MLLLAELSTETKVDMILWGIPALFVIVLIVLGLDAKSVRGKVRELIENSRIRDAEKQVSVALGTVQSMESDMKTLLGRMKGDVREAGALIDHLKSGKSSTTIKIGHFGVIFETGIPYASGWIKFDMPFEAVPFVAVSESSPGNWLVVKVDQKGKDRFKWAAHRVFPHDPRLMEKYQATFQWIAICDPTVTSVSGQGAE